MSYKSITELCLLCWIICRWYRVISCSCVVRYTTTFQTSTSGARRLEISAFQVCLICFAPFHLEKYNKPIEHLWIQTHI